MDSRRYPRVQLPLLVALKHPSLGSLRCIAKDISEGGVYVYTDNPHIGPGAKVKVTLENLLNVESQPTPTVEMEVKRVEAEGLALEFVNVTGRHLWQSVERLRTELAVGRDLFQAHLNIVVTNETGVLLTQRHGRWGFPGTFLQVGEDWRETTRTYLLTQFGITLTDIIGVVAMNSVGHNELPEAALLDLFVEARAAGEACKLAPDSRYKTARWTERRRDVEETTFATDQSRELAIATLKRLVKEEAAE